MLPNQILQSDILDIIFERRNKSYGAYNLRKTYGNRIKLALLITLALILLMVIIGTSTGRLNGVATKDRTIEIHESVLTKIKPYIKIAITRPARQRSQVATIADATPLVVKDILVKTPPPTIAQIETANIDVKTLEGTLDIGIVPMPADIKGINTTAESNKKAIDDGSFVPVEIEATFPGGPQAWQRYIQRAIVEHLDEFSNDDYGTCIVQFRVDEKGNVSDVQATTMKGSKLAEIAVNAIRKGPAWTPAMQNGRYVNAFRLQPLR
jgi:protein TonB